MRKSTPAKKSSPRRAGSPSSIQSINKAREDKWRAEADLRAVKEADEVKRDPKRMAKVKALIVEQSKALQSIGQVVGVTKTPIKK